MRPCFGLRPFVTTAFALLVTLPGPPSWADDRHALDVHRSKATFAVTHLFIGRVNGSVPIVSGTVTLDPATNLPVQIQATLDARGVATNDADRDADLQGPDWFDTKRFPLWDFKGTRIVPGSGGAFTILGELSVHGVSAPVTLAVTPVHGPPHAEYHATTQVDRHAFGMAILTTDALVGSQVTIDVEAVLE
jgi:polyisoprenoid-binding protein YceI